MQTQAKQVGLFAALILLMVATRGSHFGSVISLPDATLAIFLVAGFMLPRFTLAALAAFIVLLVAAVGIDYYAIAYNDVSDYCLSPAYWFLIPTYASMWFAGHWFASKQSDDLNSLALYGAVALLSTSVAFIISNAAFYAFSGLFAEMSALEYATRVAKYYPSYVGGGLLYLALASVIYVLFISRHKSSAGSAHP